MMWLLLSVLLNAAIFVLFRYYGRWGLPLLPVVVLNYLVCLALGLALGAPLFVASTYNGGWWVLGLVQGVLFVTFFFLIGVSTQRSGIAYTTVVTKLSVVIPVLAAIFLFEERLAGVQWLGVLVALLAILLINARAGHHSGQRDWVLGAVLFVGTGIIDSNFKVFDHYFSREVKLTTFQALVFGVAALVGALALAVRGGRVARAGLGRVIGAGILLGLTNYAAIYALLQGVAVIPASQFFPVNNVGQLVLASAAGIVLFAERLSKPNWAGIALAVGAIVLLTFEAW